MLKKRFVAAMGLLMGAAVTAGCVVETGDGIYITGSATRWAETTETILDTDGYYTEAYCGDYLSFTGLIDDRCFSRPMVRSYARSGWLLCSYYDYYGIERFYDAEFYFGSGYIAERNCNNRYYSVPSEASSSEETLEEELERVSALPAEGAISEDGEVLTRDEEGRLVVRRKLGGNVESTESSRAALRAALIKRLGVEDGPADSVQQQ